MCLWCGWFIFNQSNARLIYWVFMSASRHITAQLAMSVVICGIDYCNSAPAGLPVSILTRLRWDESMRRLLGLCSASLDDLTSLLRCDLFHWLPIKYRTNFKAAMLIHICTSNVRHQPRYTPRKRFLKTSSVVLSPTSDESCRLSYNNSVRQTCSQSVATFYSTNS